MERNSLVRLLLGGSSAFFGAVFGGAAPPLGAKNDLMSGILMSITFSPVLMQHGRQVPYKGIA